MEEKHKSPTNWKHSLFSHRITGAMKLSALSLAFSLSAFPTDVNAQQVSLNVQKAKVITVLNSLSSQTGLNFAYSAQVVDLNREVSINVNDKNLEDVLDTLFNKTNTRYEIKDGKVYLYNITSNSSQQQFTIQGTILDPSGEPIIGANILVKGSTHGTITDINGQFSLDVRQGDILRVTYIGYADQQIRIKNRKKLTITLKEDSEALDEVVVVGYGTQKKINLTGAVTTVKASKVVKDRPVSLLGQSMQGKIAGLNVTKWPGKPGSGYIFNLRGTTSLNGGGPLILVDGVESDLNMVPPEDVETISVLKDGASAAIYGSRAAFGVILVTTKSGKKDKKVQINYSNNLSWSTPTDLPEKVDPVTQIKFGGYAWGNKYGDYKTYWGHNVDTWLELYDTVKERNTYRWVKGRFYALGDTDMLKEMTETGFMHRHNISASGGSKRVSYYFNAGLMQQNGVLISDRDKYSRKNVSLKINSDVTDWLSVQLTTGYTRGKQEFSWIPLGENYLYSVSYMRPTWWLTGYNEELGAPYGYTPHWLEMGAPNSNTNNAYNLQTVATIKPIKGLEITGRYTLRINNTERNEHVNSYPTVNPASGGKEYYRNKVSSLRLDNGKTELNVIDIWAKYQHTFAEKHNASVMVGFNQETSKYQNVYAKVESLFSDNLPSLNLGSGNQYAGDAYSAWSTRSGFFRLNYDYKGRYLAEVVGRYDGSSKFRTDDRFVFFPSFSLGWRMSEESFMDWSESFLNNLKLRASFGTQGNQSISPYAFSPSMGVSRKNWLVDGKQPTIMTPAGIVSDSFTWETVKNLNFGLDMKMFNNRLGATFEYYIRKTEDMLLPGKILPSILGTSAPKENSGDLRVNGWELSVNWNDKIGNDFYYNLGFNLHDYKTVITKYDNPVGLYSSYYVGKRLGEVWGYETDRLFQEDDFIIDENGKRAYKEGIPQQDKIHDNKVAMPGDVKYKDLNGDGKIDYGDGTLDNPGDKRIIGNNEPRYQFGINMGAEYKGLDLSLFWQGVGKRNAWIGNSLVFPFAESYESMFKHTLDCWTPENTDAYYPRPIADKMYNRQIQTRYLQNAAYLRLKNLTVGYSIPKSILNKIHLNKARIFFSAENLWTLSSLPDGVDPEVGGSHTYPISRELSFGVDISF